MRKKYYDFWNRKDGKDEDKDLKKYMEQEIER
jgi:hypothetical protein